MKYLMLHNSRAREEKISDYIISELKKIDDKASIYVTYWAEPTNNIKDIILFHPDVVFTFPFTISDLVEEISLIKSVCKCRICTYTTEGFMSSKFLKEKSMGYYDYPSDLIDEYLFFGPKFKDIFIDEQKKLGRYGIDACAKAVGYPLYEFDKVCDNESGYSVFNSISTLSRGFKKVITILSGFQGVDDSIKQIRMSNDAYNAHSSDVKNEILKVYSEHNRAALYRDSYYGLIKKAANLNKDFLFVIKLHPIETQSINGRAKILLEELEEIKNIYVLYEPIPLSILLKISSCMVHYGSTGSVEAYIVNVPSIYVAGHIPDLFKSDYSIGLDEIEKLDSIIKADVKVNYSFERDDFLFSYFSYIKGQEYNPSREIASELRSLAMSCNNSYNTYIDYGYYKKLYRAYLLMALKRYALLRFEEANGYMMMHKTIAQYVKKYWRKL